MDTNSMGKKTMHTAYFAAALVAGLSVAVATVPVQSLGAHKRFSVGAQGLESKAPEPPRVTFAEMVALPPPHRPLGTITREDGRRLSCDEIRAMDEVELITDGSYCD
jgi:hypothetical protein